VRARINVRIRRLSLGNPGDVKPVGSGVSEMRVDYGPGYRVYYQQRGEVLVLLLCGGDKTSQDADIKRAMMTSMLAMSITAEYSNISTQREMWIIHAAHVLRDLASPPGNRLEALVSDCQRQHSIRINDQLRVRFVWTPHGPSNVEIVDYQ
jgi:putative addiction module killer protein